MPDLLLGIDIGTSGTKAVLLEAGGPVRATAMVEHPALYPRPGWSEQVPEDWWVSTQAAVHKALRAARAKRSDVAAIGMSGQMHGAVFLDGRGRVLHNAILWNDHRSGAECGEIEARAGGRAALIRFVRNVALTGYQAPKILWLRKHKPRVFERVRTVLLPKDYVSYRLTGRRHTEVSDASGTLLFDVVGRRWCTELMERLGLDPMLFPPAGESTTVVGELHAESAGALGLRVGTPVVAGAGDQAAAAVGTGVVRSGLVSAIIGTSGVVFAHSDEPVPNDAGVLQSYCHAAPGRWCVFGCMLSAGGSLQWAREVFYADRLAEVRTEAQRDALYADMIAAAAEAPHNDAIVFHPYLTGERCPYAHPHARAAFIGSIRADTREVLVRAVLEGITLGMRRQLELMEAARVPVREVRLAGGGARDAWWRQLQADVYGRRCVAMRSEQGSALGAALLAGVGAGVFRDVPAACRATVRIAEVYRPRRALARRYAALAAWMQATYETLEPLYRGRQAGEAEGH